MELADIDIDVGKCRESILSTLKHIPASKFTDADIIPHNVGVYFCDIPCDLLSGLASIDYKNAEDKGFMKVDILHNTVYDKFNNRTEIIEQMKKPIHWELLKDNSVVIQLPHINNYYDLIQSLPTIDSVEKLAMFLAIIRPSKKHLIQNVKSNGWDSIKGEIWKKETDGYYFKKAHAIAYAVMITLLLR